MFSKQDISNIEKERLKAREDIFSAALRYKSLYQTEVDARISIIKSTMAYGLITDAYKDIRDKKDDNGAKRLIAKMLSVKEYELEEFDISGNDDGSTNMIEFKFNITGRRYGIQFPDVTNFRYRTNEFSRPDVDFESNERNLGNLSFILYAIDKEKYTLKYTRIAESIYADFKVEFRDYLDKRLQ